MITLRPYQEALIDKIRQSIISGNRSVCAVLGCGGGKSIIMAQIAKSAGDKGKKTLFLVHRKELCEQIRKTFNNLGVSNCFICMVQTMSRRINRYDGCEYDLILTDECHHSTAKSYTKIYEHFPDAIKVGFTATPIRLNHGGLGEVYSDLVTSVSTRWLIDNHYLSDYKYYSVKLADTQGLHTVRGDYSQPEIAALMEDGVIYGDTVKQWERLAKGKKTIVYCASVKAAEETADAFLAAGYRSVALSGSTNKVHREADMALFRAGNIQILCNCELFGEGLDIPDCECVVLLRPTQSLALFVQQSMRSMRYMPGKTALIIDHVGNCYRHGLPDDDREWSLEPKKKQDNTVKIRECENCFAVYSPKLKCCPYCGAEAKHEIRTKNKKTITIDLEEIKREQEIKSTRLQDANFDTWDDIVEYQKIHKYKFMWALREAVRLGIPYPSKYQFMRYKFIKE